jgi:hypothetical protein
VNSPISEEQYREYAKGFERSMVAEGQYVGRVCSA